MLLRARQEHAFGREVVLERTLQLFDFQFDAMCGLRTVAANGQRHHPVLHSDHAAGLLESRPGFAVDAVLANRQ